jgi:hypothetical protein
MTKRRYELDTRVLTIFFFVAMPFVAFGSFIVVSMARASLQESVGLSLEQRAIETRFLIERYVGDQIVHLRLATLDPQVRAALAAPAKDRNVDETRKLEQAWASGEDHKLIAPILASPLAAHLREMSQVRPALKLIQVIDAKGRLLAASGRAGRLLNAETPWFHSLVSEGTEHPYVGDIQRTAGSLVYLEIAYPVYDAEARFQGVVRGLMDAADLYSVIAPVRVGRTGHAVLVRASDGLILASDESPKVLTQSFPGFSVVQGALQGFPLGERGQSLFGKGSQRRGYWAIPELREQGEPARLVGYADVEQVPNVKWLVTVEQDLAEAMAPIQQVTRYLWIHFVGAFGSVILLALYLSFKLEAPVIDEELHLHEEHVPSSMRTTED